MNLREISAITGYSVSVVSRALSPNPKVSSIISPRTRKMIRDAVSRSGFRPNHVASCMRRGVNPSLGVFLLRKSGSLICDTVIGISEEAALRNWPLNFYFQPVEDFCQFLSRMSKQKNMGVIAYHSVLDNRINKHCDESISRYCARGGKLVCLNHYSGEEGTLTGENISHLRFADYQGGVLAAEFLHGQGCTEYLSFTLGDNFCYLARMSGFSDYCRKHGLSYQVFPCDPPGEWNERHVAGMGCLEPFLHSSAKLGVFIPSDHVLLSYAGRLLERGFAIGRDIHLVGYDDNDFARFQPWPFATLKQDFFKEGRMAVQMLDRLLGGEPGHEIELSPELILWNYPDSQKKAKKEPT